MPLKRRLAGLALVLLLLAGSGAWYVNSRGGWANIQQLPPIVDPSTPLAQNRYILVSVTRQENYNFGPVAYLLIRPPSFPKESSSAETSDGDQEYSEFRYPEGAGPIVQATGQTSNGDILPLQWTVIGNAPQWTSNGTNTASPQYIRVEIPGGYSNKCQYIDVTLVNNAGPFPRWRITQLPPMRHVIPDSPTLTTSITQGGVTLTARAWRSWHQVNLQVRPTLPPNSHQWDLGEADFRSDWEPFDRSRTPDPSNWSLQNQNGKFFDISLFPANYRSASRFVRLNCALRQYETYDEAVTFHNTAIKPVTNKFDPLSGNYGYLSVPYEETMTTPSGIKVTLPVQGTTTSENTFDSDSLNVTLTVEPAGTANTLPASPLFRKFHRPVNIEVQFAPPYHLGSWSNDAGLTQRYSLFTFQSLPNGKRAPTPKILKDFTVIIRQRVDIQTIPMTFTVPVADTPPPDWKR